MPEALLGTELDAAAEQLAGAGVCEPRREAAAIWGVCTGLTFGEAWLRRDHPASPDIRERFREAVQRRSGGEPFAYATGIVTFRTLTLTLDRRALIPRPETEGLVELVLQRTKDGGSGTGGVVADIGTGSGCIALSLAAEGCFDRIIGTDISEVAAALARENLALVRPRTPVDIRVGDLLEALREERCRAIVSNPPYLTDREWVELDPSVREFEPRVALTSGPDGLAATRILLQTAGRALMPGGLLALEIDERRADAVRALALTAGWPRIDIHQDLFGRARYALAWVSEDA